MPQFLSDNTHDGIVRGDNQKITQAGKGLIKCAHFHAFSRIFSHFLENAHILIEIHTFSQKNKENATNLHKTHPFS